MLLGRILGWILVALAILAAGGDGLGWLQNGRLALSSLRAFWTRVDPTSLGVVQAAMQAWLPAAVWDPGITTLLAWPAVLVLGVLGILLLALCRRRPPRRRRFGALA
ncbi:hypothetical protein [Ferrovibrio xuzhouensis]|uniref:Uncharacterized protein n=1 Tax=Ferrovibrio xuzhouensis TaxID=1576914 RepID=A0ABV7VEP4_9PROT